MNSRSRISVPTLQPELPDAAARGADEAGLNRVLPSHHLGLQVHDVGRYGLLRDGMVITVEPGVYIAPAQDIDLR